MTPEGSISSDWTDGPSAGVFAVDGDHSPADAFGIRFRRALVVTHVALRLAEAARA